LLSLEEAEKQLLILLNRIIGEKCVQCGTEATSGSNGRAVNSADFNCPSCGHHFLQGDGGKPGGMCEPWFHAKLQKAHEQAALIHL
jgi:transposase-like protein